MRREEPPYPFRDRLNPDTPEWTVKLGAITAGYREYTDTSGQPQVVAHLSQTRQLPGEPEQTQSFWADLRPLQKIREWAHSLADRLSYVPHQNAMNPEHEQRFDDYRAMVFGREAKDSEKYVAVLIDRPDIGIDGREPRQEFICNLKRLDEFVNEGREFERALGQATRYYPVISVTGLGEKDGTAHAKVHGWFKSSDDADAFAAKLRGDARKDQDVADRGFRVDDPFVWPQAQTTKTLEMVVSRGPSEELNKGIGLIEWNRDREGENYVLARWQDPDTRPEVGNKATWGGKEATYDGKPLDFKAMPGEKRLQDRTREDGEWVLIRKSDGEIMDVGRGREEMTVKLHERGAIKREHDRVFNQWEELSLYPER